MRRTLMLVLLALSVWVSLAFWNSVKPLPPGTRFASLGARLDDSQVEVLYDSAQRPAVLEHELAAIDLAEQIIVLDRRPVGREVAQHLLARKRLRPNLKIVLIADPLDEVYGGTPAQYLSALERAGIIVARVRLNRLRDVIPWYSALWRLCVAWWSDPFDETAGAAGLLSKLRTMNHKSDDRQLMVADDGAGDWRSIITGGAKGDVGLELHGGLAHDIMASELQIAAWSTGDDRLPPVPPAQGRGLGSIDARFLTEGAIRSALVDAVASAGGADQISVAVRALSDRQLIRALLRAAARGARLQVLLDPETAPNHAVAGELARDGGQQVDVRWIAPGAVPIPTALAMIRRRAELWVYLGAADYTRPSLDDCNLEAAIELRLPVRAAAARALAENFANQWSSAAINARYADESQVAYWRYRLLQAGGLAPF
jgi:PLD-like domain